ncbi:hypothetical protein BJ165DRAFT_1468049 [Panaeolus papilionaceus]|nr:hypothetical protein BJ165DRAFT_1468049 [Panaeolus papilionaceus]
MKVKKRGSRAATVSPVTVQRPAAGRVISIITTALRDPQKPLLCAQTLTVAIALIRELSGFQIPQYAAKRDAMHATLHNFLVAERRTDDEIKAMLDDLSECSFDTANMDEELLSYHDFCTGMISPNHEAPASVITNAFLESIFNELANTMYEISSIAICKGTWKKWPKNTSEIMPFGPEELTKSLLQWYRIFPQSCVTHWAFRIFKVCGPLMYTPFDKHDVTNNIFVRHMRHVIDNVVNSNPTDIVSRPMADFFSHGSSFVGFMTGIVAGPQGQHPVKSLVKGSETKTVQLLSMMIYILESPYVADLKLKSRPLPDMISDTQRLAQRTFRKYRMDLPPYPAMFLHPAIIFEDEEARETESENEEDTSPLLPPDCRDIALAIYTSRCFYTCTTVGCPAFVDAYKPLRNCAGCYAVRYCSRECQKRDWYKGGYANEAGSPVTHKQVCGLISRIVSEFGGWDIRMKPNEDSVERGQMRVRTEAELVTSLLFMVTDMKNDGRLSGEEFAAIRGWAAERNDNWTKPSVNGAREYNPGYDDYEDILTILVDGCSDSELNFEGEEPEAMELL